MSCRSYLHSSVGLLVFFTALVLGSCREPLGLESNVREIVESEEILPLQVGNEWVYRVTDRAPDGSEIQTVHQTIAVIALHVLDQEHWYRIRFDNEPDKDILLARRGDGVYLRDALGNAHLFLQYPAHVGAEYALPYLDDPANTNLETLRAVLSDSETVHLSDRNFVCVRYRDRIRDKTNGELTEFPLKDWYYAKGYGLIQSIEYRDDGTGRAYTARITQLAEIRHL